MFQNIFSDIFWDKKNIFFNEVDTVKARLYLNEKVSVHKKYQVDAGILIVNSNCCYFLKMFLLSIKSKTKIKKKKIIILLIDK
jgi:fluoride ion exporter CrcB/FEX